MMHDPTNTMAGSYPAGQQRQGGWDAAKANRKTSQLRGRLTSSNHADLFFGQGDRLRQIGRYLAMNSPMAKRSLRAIKHAVLGTRGIYPRFSDDRLNDYVRAWMRKAGLRGETWRQMQGMAIGDRISAGEGFNYTALVDDRLYIGAFEPEELDTLQGILGIDFDNIGRPLRYYLRRNDLSRPFTAAVQTTDVLEAARVQHVFDRERPSALRGTSEFAQGAVSLSDLEQMLYDELSALKGRAAMAMNFRRDDGEWQDMANFGSEENSDSGSDNKQELSIEGFTLTGFPGKIEMMSADRPGTTFAAFCQIQTQLWAVSVGVPTYIVSGDASQANLSALRAADLSAQPVFENFQQDICDQQAYPIFEEVLIEASASGELAMSPRQVFRALENPSTTWAKPAFKTSQELQSIEADGEKVSLGVMSFGDLCLKHGTSFDEQLDKIEAEQADAAKRGIVIPGIGWTQKKAASDKPAENEGIFSGEDKTDRRSEKYIREMEREEARA